MCWELFTDLELIGKFKQVMEVWRNRNFKPANGYNTTTASYNTSRDISEKLREKLNKNSFSFSFSKIVSIGAGSMHQTKTIGVIPNDESDENKNKWVAAVKRDSKNMQIRAAAQIALAFFFPTKP